MRVLHRRAVLVAAVVCLTLGVLGGVAAAHHGGDGDTTIDVGTTLLVDGHGGDGGFDCHGQPTDHDCHKGGNASIGPLDLDYDGYNNGSLAARYYEFNDTFEFTHDGDSYVVAFTCHLEPAVPGGPPCTVVTPGAPA